MTRRFSSFLLAIIAILAIGTIDSQAQYLLTRHVRDVVRNGNAQLVGQLPAGQLMTLNIVLPLRDQAGLESFLTDLYDPSSPNFHHYLTVPEFTARFGPTQADYDAVVSFAKNNGLTVIGGSRDGMEVQVKGPVSAVEAAFHVSMRTYQHPTENRTFFCARPRAHHRPALQLWHVSGLDNYSIPHPLTSRRATTQQAHGIDRRQRGLPCHHRLRPLGFIPRQRHARRLLRQRTALTGAGQNLGLFEYSAPTSPTSPPTSRTSARPTTCPSPCSPPMAPAPPASIPAGGIATTPNRPST